VLQDGIWCRLRWLNSSSSDFGRDHAADEGVGRSGRLMMDVRSRRVWINQQQLVPPLSAQQFKLLWLLYENQSQVISRTDLIAAVWGEEQSQGL